MLSLDGVLGLVKHQRVLSVRTTGSVRAVGSSLGGAVGSEVDWRAERPADRESQYHCGSGAGEGWKQLLRSELCPSKDESQC